MITALLAVLCAAQPAGRLTLDEALARAASHPRLGEVRAAADQASARQAEAWAGFLPSGTALASWQPATTTPGSSTSTAPGPGTLLPSVGSPSLAGGITPFYSASIVVTQPIWDFGRTLRQVRSARLAEEAAGFDVAAVGGDVELQVRSAYYGALAAEELVAVADDAVQQMEKHVAQAQALLEVGRRTRFDVTRAQVDLASARIARIQAESGLAAARAGLAAAIGEDVGQAALVRPADLPDEPVATEAAVTAALAQRAELSALRQRVSSQREAVAAAASAFYPVVSATGQLQWKGTDFPISRSWQVGVTVSLPFLSGGADAARVREQAAALAQARSALDSATLQVKAEAEQATLAVGDARARRQASETLLAQARENLEMAEGRYASGVGNIIELADAQAALTAARGQHVRASYDLATARARLAKATGAPAALAARGG
jgi:outer membrane protein